MASTDPLIVARSHGPDSAVDEEHRRLRELRALKLLDSPPEERFDRLTRLAAACLETPRAFIGLTDSQRTWVKSSHGFRGDEHPVETLHTRFPAHASAVIRSRSGWALGTLAVLDTQPRTFEPRQIHILESLARLVEGEIYRSTACSDKAEGTAPPERCDLTHLWIAPAALEHLRTMLEHAERTAVGVALVIADIADFKAINSAFGRARGDRILREAALRLVRICPSEALVFRVQGDQFGVALKLAAEPSTTLDGLLRTLSTSFLEPLDLDGHPVSLQLVFGTAVFPHRASSVDELMDRAILALRRAQEQRTSAAVFTTELEERLVREVAVEQALRSALAEQRLSVAYQPKVALGSGEICSVEALCRFIDPDLGPISPLEFIPAAERTGLILELGRQVLRAALLDILRLRERQPHLTVSVNISAAQLKQDGFVDDVLDLILDSGAPAEALELEVVETSVIESIDRAADVIERLRAHGIAFSLDDFGTGYSSLAYLHRLPVQSLKIDRGFVRNMTVSPRDAALVASVISMAHVLDFAVVAEGVETQNQADMLCSLGCDMGQGFLWAKPMPVGQVFGQLRREPPPTDASPKGSSPLQSARHSLRELGLRAPRPEGERRPRPALPKTFEPPTR